MAQNGFAEPDNRLGSADLPPRTGPLQFVLAGHSRSSAVRSRLALTKVGHVRQSQIFSASAAIVRVTS
jgi:hypothetical protein